MSRADLEKRAAGVRENRTVTAAKHSAKAGEGDANTDKFRILWDTACPEHRGAWGGHLDMKHAMEKVTVLYSTVGDVPEFLAWVVAEWHSLKFRTGTDWMAKKDMIPRHPNMRFVLHHWSHFHAAYTDRAQQKNLDYVDPEVEALREDIGFLEGKLREAANFGQEAQLLKARVLIEKLERENQRLRALFAPFVDLDSDDVPTWEEKQNAKV